MRDRLRYALAWCCRVLSDGLWLAGEVCERAGTAIDRHCAEMDRDGYGDLTEQPDVFPVGVVGHMSVTAHAILSEPVRGMRHDTYVIDDTVQPVTVVSGDAYDRWLNGGRFSEAVDIPDTPELPAKKIAVCPYCREHYVLKRRDVMVCQDGETEPTPFQFYACLRCDPDA